MKAIILLLLALFYPVTVIAQVNQQSFYAQVTQLCSEGLPETRLQCDAFIKGLEPKEDVSSMLLLATAYGWLHLHHQVGNKALSDEMKQQELSIYHKVLVIEPNNTEALFGLSVYSPREEKLNILRKILILDKKNRAAISAIASWLEMGNNNEKKEAIQILADAYREFEGDQKWQWAQMLYKAYIANGQKNMAVNFRASVLDDMGITAFTQSDETAMGQLHLSCDYIIMLLDLPELCFNDIRLVMHHDGSTAARLKKNIDKLLPALTTLLPERYKLQKQFRDVQIELRDALEAIKETGEDSLAFYLAYGIVLTGYRRVEALQKANEADPDRPGKATYWLADAWADIGKIDEAVVLYRQLIAKGAEPYSNIARDALQAIQNKGR